MHHIFYSNRRYLSYPFQPYETSLTPIFARYSPYTLLISAGTFYGITYLHYVPRKGFPPNLGNSTMGFLAIALKLI